MDKRRTGQVQPSRQDWHAQELVLLSALKEGECRLDQMRMREVPLMRRETELREKLAQAQAEAAAVRTVLGAVLASVKPGALDRRGFQTLVAQAGREVSAAGPQAMQHAVMLAEARRVLGVEG